MNKPYGILRFHPDAKPISIRYKTREARDKKAQEYANRDGGTVGLEEWMKPDEWSQWDWWLTGSVEPEKPKD